jgi:hypothetical protein
MVNWTQLITGTSWAKLLNRHQDVNVLSEDVCPLNTIWIKGGEICPVVSGSSYYLCGTYPVKAVLQIDQAILREVLARHNERVKLMTRILIYADALIALTNT